MRWQLDALSFSEIDDCRGGCINGKIQIAQAPRLPLQLKGIRRGNAFATNLPPMIRVSYLSPKTEVRESKIHGRGLFATADIAKDEIVAVKGGHIVDRKTLRDKITPRLGPVEIQIDDDLFIAPVTDEERELSMLYSNHSCDANLGIRGEITFVAMRDICAGEELTHDWAMTDDDDYSVECRCGAPNCRKTVTGKDWQRLELQKRCAGYFSAYLAQKIAGVPFRVKPGTSQSE
jgi:uncharacterized protein